MSPAAVQVEDREQEKESSPEGKSDVSTYATDDFPPASGTHSGVRSLSMFSHGGVLPTAVCLSKAAIGAGVLTMSGHAAEVGLVFQTSSLIGGAVLSLASIRFIATACTATGCYSYEDLCDELLHPVMALFTGFMNTLNCIGSAGNSLASSLVHQSLSAGCFSCSRASLFVLHWPLPGMSAACGT